MHYSASFPQLQLAQINVYSARIILKERCGMFPCTCTFTYAGTTYRVPVPGTRGKGVAGRPIALAQFFYFFFLFFFFFFFFFLQITRRMLCIMGRA